jgi:hypothetical protein
MHSRWFESSKRPATSGDGLRKPNREQLFALGVVLGTAAGLVIGSLVAWYVSAEGADSVRRALERAVGHEDDRPKFELLLQ